MHILVVGGLDMDIGGRLDKNAVNLNVILRRLTVDGQKRWGADI